MKTFKPEICPVCEQGMWMPHADGVYTYKHGRQVYNVSNQQYALCNHCGVKGFLPGQRDANIEALAAYEERLPGYISRSSVLAIREKYNLTQAQANQIFGGGKQGYSKWERGVSVPAGPTARLMKLALRFPEVIKELALEVGLGDLINNLSPELRPRVVTVYVHSDTVSQEYDEVMSSELNEDLYEVECESIRTLKGAYVKGGNQCPPNYLN